MEKDLNKTKEQLLKEIDLLKKKLAEFEKAQIRQKSLEEINTRHSAMIENIGDVIAILGDDGKTKYQSPNIEKWFGWKPEDLIGSSGWDKMHPDDIERIQIEFSKMLEKETASIVEYRFKCKDGIYKWIELTAVNRINDPIINGVLLNYHDITDRKLIEEKLHLSESSLRKTFEASPSIICIADSNIGTFVEVNHAVTTILGYSVEEFKSKPFIEFVHPDDRQRTNDEVTEQLQGNSIANFENRYHCKDGSYKWISWQATKADMKGMVYAVGTDITKRKQADNILEQHKQNLANTIEGTNAGIWDWNIPSGECVFNERWAEIMGYSLEELMPVDINTWINNVHPDDLPMANSMLDKLFNKTLDYLDIVFRQPHKDGNWVWVNARGKVVDWSEEGKPLRISGTHLDITKQMQGQEELRKYREHLEETVKQRTAEVDEKNKKLSDQMKVFVGRELKIKDLEMRIRAFEGA